MNLESSFGAYLDGAPVRRRLRAALLILFVGALCVIWWSAVPKAWDRFLVLQALVPVTTSDLFAAFERCQEATIGPDPYSTVAVNKAAADNDALVGSPGACHPANADEINASRRGEAFSGIGATITKPLPKGVVALVLAIAAWIIIPLAERRSIEQG